MIRSRISVSYLGLTLSLLGAGAACNGEGSAPSRSVADQPIKTAAAVPSDDGGPVNAPPELLELARTMLAERGGVPAEELTITNATPVEFPLQSTSLYAFKGTNPKGDALSIALTPDGVEADLAKLTDIEQQKYEELNGHLTPDLAARLVQLADDDVLDIAVEALVPEGADAGGPARPDPRERLSDEQLDQLYKTVDAHRAQVASQLTSALRDRLAELGAEPSADELAPVVHARLPVSKIREVARWHDVSKVYEAPIFEPDLQISRSVVEADIVNGRGIIGTGVRVAEIEVGGAYHAANPYLAGTLQDWLDACVHPHATWVAGVIRSTHTVIRGMAPSVTLRVGGSCGGILSQLQAASNRASSWGARAFNLSWGSYAGTQPGSADNFYDRLVQDGWRTVVAAAGNGGLGNRVASPARGYNLITAGSLDDLNTVPWLGDVMSSFSSSGDPVSTYGDREKPELVAPGSNIQTTAPTAPWNHSVVSGTSFAAPTITGLAALLMQRRSALTVWPESVKAILMATANHNVEGAAGLSEHDGAGAVVGALADDVSQGASGNWGGIGYTCSAAYYTTVATMTLYSNRPTRVAVVWDTNPSYAQYASRPSADLDVAVFDPAGNFVAGSGSWDNTYELVAFTPAVTGPHTIRVTKYSCALNPKWLGWAWYQNY